MGGRRGQEIDHCHGLTQLSKGLNTSSRFVSRFIAALSLTRLLVTGGLPAELKVRVGVP